MSSRFFYTPEIETKIPVLIKDILQTDVVSLEQKLQGHENIVFKVVTPEKPVILRIFCALQWTGETKIRLVEEKLNEINFPHPKLLYVSLDDTYFPYGFMIAEYIDGENGKDAIENGMVGFETFHEQLFGLLSQLHKVQFDTFGFLNEEGFDNVVDFKLDQITSSLDRVGETDILEKKEKIHSYVRKNLTPVASRITPVLIHYDPTPSNTIYTSEGKIILIDWDAAASECFMRDIAWLNYWASDKTILWKVFRKQYKQEVFSEEELQKLESMYHLGIAVDLLPHYKSQENTQMFQETKNRLHSLLNSIK